MRRHGMARALAVVAAIVVPGLLLGACDGAASSAPDASPAPTGAPPSPVPSTAPEATPPQTASPGPTQPTSTVTAWGSIWDAVPAEFPAPDGAEPVDLNEPVSAAWARGGRRVQIAEGMRTSLVEAGWSIEASTEGEDGSIAIDAVKGAPDCRAQVRVEPRGDQVFIIVLFAAACPWS